MPDTRFAAIILAGERPGPSPVAEAANTCCKAMALVDGQPMVLRVLDALGQAGSVTDRVLCAADRLGLQQQDGVREGVETGQWRWCDGRESPSTSAAAALATVDPARPVLVTTADHALLTPELVDTFCSRAAASGADVAVGLVRFAAVRAAYPDVRRTVMKFSDDGYCGCNLFAFLTPEGRRAAEFWQKVEAQRKRPWKVMGIIGWGAVLRYLLGRLSLEQALDRIAGRMGLRVQAVILDEPAASVDVDTVEDLAFADRLARQRGRR